MPTLNQKTLNKATKADLNKKFIMSVTRNGKASVLKVGLLSQRGNSLILIPFNKKYT